MLFEFRRGKAPTELRLYKPGNNPTNLAGIPSLKYDPTRRKELAKRQYKEEGRLRLHIDINHSSFSGSYEPHHGQSYGDFRLEYRIDGIYAADIRWSPEGRELVESRKYVYWSPTTGEPDKGDHVGIILGFSLTNTPAKKHLKPLTFSRKNQMAKKQTEDKVDEKVDETEKEATPPADEPKDELPASEEEKDSLIETLKTELDAANDYIRELELKLDALTDEEDPDAPAEEEETKVERSPVEIVGALVQDGFVLAYAAPNLMKLSVESLIVRDKDLRAKPPLLKAKPLTESSAKKSSAPKAENTDPKENRIYKAWERASATASERKGN